MNFENPIVLLGPALVPHRCQRLTCEGGIITEIVKSKPEQRIYEGTVVIVPGLVNAHTHVGDAFLPDGATGLTLEEGFFRPNGFKYRELAKCPRSEHVEELKATLAYMARTGTVAHFDFREQGAEGASRLREASEATGVRSVILGQFDCVPFTAGELEENTAPFNEAASAELDALLEIADGFSESTMNDLTDAAWREVRTRTSALDKARAIHCLENAGYREVSVARTGRGDLIRAIELYAPDLIVHLTVANAEEIDLLADHKVHVVLNPRANANLGLPLPPIAALLDAGVNCLLGTDNGLLNSPNMLAELDYTYKLTKSQYGDAQRPDPAAILAMATANVAKTRWGSELPGILEPGRPATFTVFDFHQPHLRRSCHITASVVTRVTPEDVRLTVREGRILHHAGSIPGFSKN